MVEVAIFAPRSPRVHALARDHLDAGLETYSARWPEIDFRIRHYVTPPGCHDYVFILGEQPRSVGQAAIVAGSASTDPGEAAAIFCGELTERTAAGRYRSGHVRHVPANELEATGARFLRASRYVGSPLDASAWPYRPFRDDEPYDWIVGEDLRDGEEVWVPALFVDGGTPRELRFCETTTIGCAFGHTRDVATENAVREIYERDVLRRAWYGGWKPSTFGTPPGWDRWLTNDVETGWRTRFFQVEGGRTDVVLVYSKHETLPIYAIGSAPAGTSSDGWEHAVREALQGRLVAWLYRDSRSRPKEIASYHDHMLWYSQRDRIQHVDEFFSGDPTNAHLPEAAESRLVAVDLLAEPGASVVRVLGDSLQRMEAGHTAATVAPDLLHRRSLNLRPHPFG